MQRSRTIQRDKLPLRKFEISTMTIRKTAFKRKCGRKISLRGVILPDTALARATASVARAISSVDRDAISLEALHNTLDRSSSARLCAKSSAVYGDICRP